jgi:hypothetical protein
LTKRPIISVDGERKESMENTKNVGQAWCQPTIQAHTYDIPDDTPGCAVPSDIYDRQCNHSVA